MNHKKIGIYIHIPFCVQKCLYCDFVSGPANIKIQEDYVNQLLREIQIRSEKVCTSGADSYIVDTVFIGGGTPSVLPADWMELILCKLKEAFVLSKDCEITIEVNPGTADFQKLEKYKKAGVNRLSIGLQSCNDEELKMLGRIHNYQEFLETYRFARQVGFNNINVDLMSAIPGQTVESFRTSLEKVCALQPEHVSVYSLIVEEGTPFYEMDLDLPEEETERRIYYETNRILKQNGFMQYEISNYAKEGYECRHNVRYWECKEYLGLGCAAASFVNGIRWKNTENLGEYIRSETLSEEGMFFCEKDVLSMEDLMSEFVFMGLRMNEGVSKTVFKERFGEKFDGIYGETVKKHVNNGLLKEVNDRIQLTEKGRDICNYVMADFLL